METDKLLDLLIKSLDSDLSDEDQKKLEKALADLEILREEKKRLLRMRKLLVDQDLQFSENFSQRVMSRINQEKRSRIVEFNFIRDLNRIFLRVAISGVAAIIILLLSIYLTAGSFSLDSLSGTETYSEENIISYLLYDN